MMGFSESIEGVIKKLNEGLMQQDSARNEILLLEERQGKNNVTLAKMKAVADDIMAYFGNTESAEKKFSELLNKFKAASVTDFCKIDLSDPDISLAVKYYDLTSKRIPDLENAMKLLDKHLSECREKLKLFDLECSSLREKLDELASRSDALAIVNRAEGIRCRS